MFQKWCRTPLAIHIYQLQAFHRHTVRHLMHRYMFQFVWERPVLFLFSLDIQRQTTRKCGHTYQEFLYFKLISHLSPSVSHCLLTSHSYDTPRSDFIPCSHFVHLLLVFVIVSRKKDSTLVVSVKDTYQVLLTFSYSAIRFCAGSQEAEVVWRRPNLRSTFIFSTICVDKNNFLEIFTTLLYLIFSICSF